MGQCYKNKRPNLNNGLKLIPMSTVTNVRYFYANKINFLVTAMNKWTAFTINIRFI